MADAASDSGAGNSGDAVLLLRGAICCRTSDRFCIVVLGELLGCRTTRERHFVLWRDVRTGMSKASNRFVISRMFWSRRRTGRWICVVIIATGFHFGKTFFGFDNFLDN